MTARRLHLVRHGEVHNPARVLYGRLPDYHLSDAGRRMAHDAAEHVASLDRPVSELRCSPLERTQESAEPFTELFGLEAVHDVRIIEPANVFEGKRMSRALRNPFNWRHLRRPSVPSWGEAYTSVAQRMRAAMDEAWDAAERGPAVHDGDIVFVSHQAPIWITHLSVAGLPLRHDPRTRRCALSSVTSFERVGDVWREIEYVEPAAKGIDLGAV
ncbi:histidine phosphatase family protein [Microbacterium esteraromaticum]|uniref:Histidine phosphatase family protein n=1 Tax=Microbacterium esteraromaticum TaxID=57043 RepID=A0A7D7WEK9_9MICO|nr:histidine phosphatase family protein [Microbacterium esteraromaticum]QMU97319.1 histidine phosphatase family protein [Microbacterium esteraromaticum]